MDTQCYEKDAPNNKFILNEIIGWYQKKNIFFGELQSFIYKNFRAFIKLL